MKEEELLQSYFMERDIKGISPEEFQVAVMGLIEQGLMEMTEVNGTKIYRPTALLRKIKTHLNSDPKMQS